MSRGSAMAHGSTKRDGALREKERKRKKLVSRPHMLVQNLVKPVLGRKFRAMYDLNMAQVLKTHGTFVAVLRRHSWTLHNRVCAIYARAELCEAEFGRTPHVPCAESCRDPFGKLRF